MNEAETRAELIDLTLREAGWGLVEGSRVRRELITLGRLEGAGRRGKQGIADYVLMVRDHKLAVIETKKRSLPVTQDLARRRSMRPCCRPGLPTPPLYQVDLETGEGYVDRSPL